ncbi:MAG TPA: hypothetical protein VFE47_18395 [Tepidisphaeraceae bacterium]|nr:hypothetical protein [Tepidisphaeraceae bacterium]
MKSVVKFLKGNAKTPRRQERRQGIQIVFLSSFRTWRSWRLGVQFVCPGARRDEAKRWLSLIGDDVRAPDRWDADGTPMGHFLSQKCPEYPIGLAGGFLAERRKDLGGNELRLLKRSECPIFDEKSQKMGHFETWAMVRTILGRKM